ncbi:CPCC family cysteine-rich protein [Streptomyces sp. NPDC021080]|uniref:CPCC family cysteine-rich protein n=1 Tax=Streptomyces sp. NPDC021080 TaxID=3365110 RepID=UPI0037B9C8BF
MASEESGSLPRRPQLVDGGPYECPCCRLMTLETSANFEICPECGWEDDGQDDFDADEVLGGPNGAESLTEARERYAAYLAESAGPDSVTQGGEGSWLSAAKRKRPRRTE